MRNKQLLLTSLILLVSGLWVKAATITTFTVKAGGGGNFTTIQACVAAMSSSGGDTCVVFAGSYSGSVTITSGTVGNYNTVTNNPGDSPTLAGGFVMGSHTRLIGMVIDNPSNPNGTSCVDILNGTTDAYITSNIMKECGSGAGGINESGMINMRATTNPATASSNIYIQNNTLSYGCSTIAAPNVCSGMQLNGNRLLVEGNDLSHLADGVDLYGDHIVFRNNTFHDILSTDCGSHSSNCHVDMVESESGTSLPFANGLLEGNYITNNPGSNAHMFLLQADVCSVAGGCRNIISRYNHAYRLGTFWLLDQLGNFSHVKDYNNTVVCAMFDGTTCGASGVDVNVTAFQGSTNGAEVNNIYYNSVRDGISGLYYGGSAPFRANNNLAYMTSCAPSCSFSNPYSSEVGRMTNQDPKFVNSASDWHLQSGSPAIGAGANLTTAVGSGSGGTSLTVADADYFFDAVGLTSVGVQADWIRIGASTTVQIASVNYSTRTITLASAVSWNNGDPIYLYKNSSGVVVLSGANPDIGAFPSGSSSVQVQPPTSLQATVN